MHWKAIRYRIKGALAGWRVPILRGPLQGRWISLFCGTRFVRGDCDAAQVDAVVNMLQPGDVFYDVGAHVGYYSMAAAQRVGSTGTVYAFEPLPLNRRMLCGHIRANRMTNVELIEACVGDQAGTARFDLGKGTGRGRMGAEGAFDVPVVALDLLLRDGALRPPSLIKMDVEGAELLALQGAREMLARYKPTLLLSVHSEALRAQCAALLLELGFCLSPTAKPGQIVAGIDMVDPSAPWRRSAASGHADRDLSLVG